MLITLCISSFSFLCRFIDVNAILLQKMCLISLQLCVCEQANVLVLRTIAEHLSLCCYCLLLKLVYMFVTDYFFSDGVVSFCVSREGRDDQMQHFSNISFSSVTHLYYCIKILNQHNLLMNLHIRFNRK